MALETKLKHFRQTCDIHVLPAHRRVAPTTRLPRFNESPLFLRGEDGRLAPVAPLGEARCPRAHAPVGQ